MNFAPRTVAYIVMMVVLVATMATMCSQYSVQMAEYRNADTSFECRPGAVYTVEECK